MKPLKHMRVTWLLVAGLFLLRLPLLTGGVILFPQAAWVDPLWEVGTYLLTAVLIWWERGRLADFHIDALVLIFFFAKPLDLLLGPYDLTGPYLLYIPIALGLALALLISRPILASSGSRLAGWMLVGLLAGLALAVYFAAIFKVYLPAHFYRPTFSQFISVPVHQMLMAGLGEEAFFRGFLWGCLRKAGLRDLWILLLQAALFWLGHLYSLLYAPFSFWLIVPVGGLVLGLLAWRSRSIAPGILAHGLANGLSQFMG